MSFLKKILSIFGGSMEVPKKNYKTVLPDARDLSEAEIEVEALEASVQMPVADMLDLHHFSPKEFKHLIPDYLDECRENGIYEVRIVHGKGKGVLLKTVHSILSKLEQVDSYKLGDETSGGWGATWVQIRKEKTN